MNPDTDTATQYWRRNLQIIFSYLAVWFLVSFGCGIVFVDELNQFNLFGFKLGYWFANQGSIFVFVILIFIYIQQMKKLDLLYKHKNREED